ncbi:uncharacterized protein LOC105836186 [Monomorium pharaonis]|uniref:uncharacterized protein LOC105836186 n=1 Tax=Monomorium pharaonis TaxID=307658 RepID=UPI00174707C9|nr:uncharacterized protein LOC105836186 [Monomorium pharaonis]
MALSGSSIVIVFIGVAAYAAAGPVQAGPNTLQQNEYGGLADLLARYWEDRRTIQDANRNLDQIGSGHLVRNTDKQFKGLLNEEESGLTQYLNSAGDKQIFDTIHQEGLANQFRNENLINSSINSLAFADTISHPYSSGQANNQLFMDQLVKRDVPNAREAIKRIVKNLDQIGGGHLVRTLDQTNDGYLIRNLDQIGGGHLVRNLDHIGGGHLVRNLDQIGGGHLVRNLDQIGGGHLVRNLDHIGGGHLVRNLDQIGGGHLLRNLDQIGGGNLIRSLIYPNTETKHRVDQSESTSDKLHFTRNLDQIGGGNLLRNLEIGGGNLVRNLDQIGGGNLVRSLKCMGNHKINGVGGGHLLRQERRGLDSLSGATFGESKRFIPFRRPNMMNVRPINFDESDQSGFDRFSKRNIDEIDTAFDSFFKRNFDEIDRASWDGFVKRFNNYLTDRQRR